jgi:hypothetical protein
MVRALLLDTHGPGLASIPSLGLIFSVPTEPGSVIEIAKTEKYGWGQRRQSSGV